MPLRRRGSPVERHLASTAAAACLAVGLGLWATVGQDGSRSAARVPLQGATGELAVDSKGNGTLRVVGLEPAPPGRTYEIWVIKRGARPEPAGLFARGGATGVDVTRDIPRGATVAVTIEQAGGVAAPTGTPLCSAEVPV